MTFSSRSRRRYIKGIDELSYTIISFLFLTLFDIGFFEPSVVGGGGGAQVSSLMHSTEC